MLARTVPQSPTLADILDRVADNTKAGIWTALPGRVESFDVTSQRAAVQPLVKNVYYDENEERRSERLPVCEDVPVMFPGAGPFRLTFPIAQGDLGLLVFTSCSMDKLLALGGEIDPVADPGADRRNHLADAVFITGFYTFNAPPTSAPDDAMVMHASTIKLGGDDASDPVVRRSDLVAVVNRLEGHSHTLSGTDSNGDTMTSVVVSEPTGSFSTPACSPVVVSK